MNPKAGAVGSTAIIAEYVIKIAPGNTSKLPGAG